MIETLEKTQDLSERILDAFAAQEGRRADDPLASTRAAAMGEFQRLGLPTKKNEAWKYTRVEKTLRHPYDLVPTGANSEISPDDAQRLRLPDLDAHLVVVVNGSIRQDLSDHDALPSGVEIRPLLDYIRDNPEEARDHVARLLDDSEDPFGALNTAFVNDGVFLRVPGGVTLERPIQIAFLTDLDGDAIIQPRNLYIFGENSEAMVVETFQSVGDARVFNNAVTEVLVDKAARVNLLKLQFESDHADRIDTTQVVQQNGASHFAGHTYTLGGGLVRNNMNVRPAGHGCESHLYGLYILGGEQHVDNHTLIDHAAPGCFSNELYRGIVDEHSTGVFNGKVFVRRDSQQTNAYQSSQGVVLSENATHYSKPELEIYADDVKCSHGSTTGELEPEHVFYLRSRGIDKTTAKSLLLYAFARDIVDQLPHEALRAYLDGLIEERIVRSAAK
jgi:Fe-S cluster assembly protein SufD